jgi:hypothetical protein
MNLKKYLLFLLSAAFSFGHGVPSFKKTPLMHTSYRKRIKYIVERIKDIFEQGPQKSFAAYCDELIGLLNGIKAYENFCKDLEYIKHEKRSWIILLHLRSYASLIPDELRSFLKTIPAHKKRAIFEEILNYQEI